MAAIAAIMAVMMFLAALQLAGSAASPPAATAPQEGATGVARARILAPAELRRGDRKAPTQVHRSDRKGGGRTADFY